MGVRVVQHHPNQLRQREVLIDQGFHTPDESLGSAVLDHLDMPYCKSVAMKEVID